MSKAPGPGRRPGPGVPPNNNSMRDVTNEPDDESFPRVVAMARLWLVVLGTVWLILGVALSVTEFSTSPWLCLLLLSMAVVHFLVARFGSHRVALIFSVYFP